MGGQYFVCQFPNDLRSRLQVCKKVGSEAATNPPLSQLASQWVLAAFPLSQANLVIDLPDSVGLQMIKGQLGMDGLSRLPKVPVQTGKGLFQLIEK